MDVTPSPTATSTGSDGRSRWCGGGVRLCLVLLLLVPLSACATKADLRDLREDIEDQNRQQEQLLEQILQEQSALSDSLGAMGAAQRQGRGDMARQLAQIQNDVLEALEFIGLSQQQLAAVRDELERDRALTGPGPATGPGARFEPDGTEASELYDDAMSQFRRGSFMAARFGFEELVDRFADHPLAPAARFFIGEIHEQNEDFDLALEAFMAVAEFHPDADEVPDALYRAAILHLELGDAGEARSLLARVVNTWPDADVAALARDELGRIP